MLRQDLLWELQQTLKILIGGGSRISGKAVSTEGDEYVLRKFSLCLSSPTLSSVPKEPYKSQQFLTSASYIIAWKHLPYIIPFGPIITLKSKQRGYYLSPFSRYRQPHRGTVTCSRSGLVSCMVGTWSQGPSLYLPLSLSYVTLTLDSTILNVHWHGWQTFNIKSFFQGKASSEESGATAIQMGPVSIPNPTVPRFREMMRPDFEGLPIFTPATRLLFCSRLGTS